MRCRIRFLRCPVAPSAEPSAAASKKPSLSEAEREYRSLLKSKVASYPCRGLTRPLTPMPIELIRRPSFDTNIARISNMAKELDCMSFCGPKAHWSSPVIVIKKHPSDAQFDVWVNPEVPGYDDKNSVASMFGMWENCASCGLLMAWVVRPQEIVATGLDEYGEPKTEVLRGLQARLFMHELDHLQGKSMMNQCPSSEFVVSLLSIHQRSLWPVHYPSAEAYVTLPGQFFDYTTNSVMPVPGLAEFTAQTAREMFDRKTIRQ